MASLGTGVIILIVIWAITIVSLALFTFAQSPIRFVGLLFLIIAVIVTLVLTLLPRGDAGRTLDSNKVTYSYAALARILILTFLCVTFLVGLVILFFHEVLVPVFAEPVQKRFL